MSRIGRKIFAASGSLGLALALGGCASVAPPGPVEVTRFHDATALATLGQGTVFVENAPGEGEDSLALAPYKAAVARELTRLGYREASRADAATIAQLRVERFSYRDESRSRGPVSVGVGGSTGSYGSGVGLGIGINLGGNKNRDRSGTRMAVMLRQANGNQAVWEGRAELEVAATSPLAEAGANASVIAEALFRDFPGGNGETVQIKTRETGKSE